MEELLEIMQDMKPGVDFTAENDLIEDGIFDSLDIVTLVTEICDKYDIEITPLDVIPENFKSAETIYKLITRLQNED